MPGASVIIALGCTTLGCEGSGKQTNLRLDCQPYGHPMAFGLRIAHDIDLVAVVALLLSIGALLAPLVRGRKARIAVRLESYDPKEGYRTRSRVVVVNHGPADARNVHVEIFADGQPMNPTILIDPHVDSHVLYPGEEHHMSLTFSIGDSRPDSVTVTWQDRRRGRQQQVFWPTFRDVT